MVMNYYSSKSAFIELPVTKSQQQHCEFYLNNFVNFKVYLEMCDAVIISWCFLFFFLARSKQNGKKKSMLISQHIRRIEWWNGEGL